jgi:hypothetical protein
MNSNSKLRRESQESQEPLKQSYSKKRAGTLEKIKDSHHK